jgi:hypothetical protein
MSGYLDLAYARSLAAWGRPHFLAGSGGSLLVRDIPGADAADAMGPYPFFACSDWSGLAADLAGLRSSLVCVSMVTDPFGRFDEALLRHIFLDLCVPYKKHYVVDLEAEAIPQADNHRRNVRRGLASVVVDVATGDDASSLLDAWCDLYGGLVERHEITGPQRFSRAIFAEQLKVSGLVAFLAKREGEVVGMTLWYEQADVAYYHLGAYSSAGYEHRASFAIFASAIEYFRPRLRWLSLGAGAGAAAESGLTRFKRGWATGERQTYLCGAILDADRYAHLAGATATTYFPAYRSGEFLRSAPQ